MKTIRAGLHLQKRKIGRSKEETKGIIEGMLGKDSTIEVEGLDLTPLQYRAVHAIQTLLHQTDYEGNEKSKVLSIDQFHMAAYYPILKIKPAEYYQAFGCKKYEYKGRNQYSSNEKSQAMAALRGLYEERFILYYWKKIFHDNRPPEDKLVRVNMPLINIAEDHFIPIKQTQVSNIVKSKEGSREVTHQTADSRITHLILQVSPIFFDQIDSYFIKKPVDYLLEIKQHYPKASKYVYNFIEYVLTRAAQLKGKHIRISKEKLAVSLRMNGFIENHQLKKLDQALKKCYDAALNLGYIKSYSTLKGKTMDEVEIIKINYDKLGKLIDFGSPTKSAGKPYTVGR
ncbi:MAG: hypothetical protein HN936_15435 [Bacteroidetes bacterium]|jgi:hypothetical protein|nr:hypothetical protein [Bacteroidota bacterium]